MHTTRTTPAWLLVCMAVLPCVAACTAAHGLGVCDPPCAAPLTCCAGACLDRATDPRNCGGCGVLCRSSQACVGGVCTRASDAGAGDGALVLDAGVVDDTGACRPACVPPAVCFCGGCAHSLDGVPAGDGRADATFANCGACGVACNPTAASRCGQIGGAGPLACRCGDGPPCDVGLTCQSAPSMPGGFVCVGAMECGPGAPPCSGGHECVAGRCVCGSLGHRCEGGGTCSAGTCTCNGVACPPGTICDGFACVDVSSDPNNCGAIGHFCGSGQSCALGMCVCGGALCPPGTGCVAGTCVDLMSDPQNCGFLGRACGVGETCALGTCRCGLGPGCPPFGPLGCAMLCCTGTCVDSTVGHCAACDDVCGSGESCASIVGMPGSLCVDRTMNPETMLCGAGAGPLCAGVDCGASSSLCAIGVCDERTGACVAVPRPDGTLCSPGVLCRSGRCSGGSCLPTDDPLCRRCPGDPVLGPTYCRAGSCGASPTSVTYDFETAERPGLWGLAVHGPAWVDSTTNAHGGTHATEAGPTAPGAESWLSVPLDVGGPTRVSLWAAIDADPATDELDVWLNGVLLRQLRGATGWQEIVSFLDVAPISVELSVRFVRGAGSSAGAGTAWVDDVTFESAIAGEPLCR